MKREDFAQIINDRNYTTIVEIGVEKGIFSAHLLKNCPQIYLMAVDIWDKPGIKKQANSALVREGWNRYLIWQTSSLHAASIVRDNYFDFIYIDAMHDYDSFMQDLVAWHPKLREGGMIAGHDYNTKLIFNKNVKGAVDDYFTALGLIDDVMSTDERCPSWYITKPQGEKNESA